MNANTGEGNIYFRQGCRGVHYQRKYRVRELFCLSEKNGHARCDKGGSDGEGSGRAGGNTVRYEKLAFQE